MKHFVLTSLFIFALINTLVSAVKPVRLGIDVLLTEKKFLIQGKRVGLITNPTGLTSSHQSSIDALHALPGVRLTALFGPEHGVRGDADAGEHVEGHVDEKTGVQVFSLYGRVERPTSEMLREVDVLIYDIQDIGSRAYTYIYTMARCMEAAKEKGIPFLVLDRPNPIDGNLIEGPVLEPKFSSGIGLYPIPYIYGMTVGELARYFNKEFAINCDLTVVPMTGWQRQMRFDETGVMWVPTSPHIPYPMTVWSCATTGCIGELHQVCEGVGMPGPFDYIGAPWIKADDLARELNDRAMPGVYFRPLHFKPFYGRFKGIDLQGVQIHIVDMDAFRPMFTQIHILCALHKLYPEKDIYNTNRIDMFRKAMGTDQVEKQIKAGWTAEKIVDVWHADLEKFKQTRKKYLIY